MPHFTIALAATVAPRRLTVHQRDYVVAPVVMLVEGVLNGAYIAADELVPQDWNGVPLVANHPLGADGLPISARDPAVLAQYGIGHIYHAQLSTGRRGPHAVTSLRAELWLDIAQAEALGGDALQAMQMLEAQELVECSTGFYSESEPQSGVFHGTPYTHIHHAIRPDHLALLPNAIGACSIAQGCGTPRLHEQACQCGGACATCPSLSEVPFMASTPPVPLWQRVLAMLRLVPQPIGDPVLTIQQTDMDIRTALYGALAREMGNDVTMTPYFIQDLDVVNQRFTYRMGERTKQRRWSMDENGILSLDPMIEDVQPETIYRPVTQEQQQEEPPMLTDVIKRRADGLIAHSQTRWTEQDRHLLEAMDEAMLIRLEQQPLEPPVTMARQPETVQEAIAGMPQHLQEPMHAMAQEYEQRKASAISVLVANKANPFTPEELQGMTAQRLEQLVTMAGEEVPLRPGQQVVKEIRLADFRGRGMPHLRAVAEDELPPTPPNTFEKAVERQKATGRLAIVG